MIGLSLSENTRAAALDGALSFSVLLHNQRELTISAAQSGVSGLISAIRSAPADYAHLLEAASGAVAAQEQSFARLREPAWAEASSASREAIQAAVRPAFAALAEQPAATFQLTSEAAPTTYLSTWGTSGAITLTTADGKGVFITHDGQVDTIPPSGKGWQFKTDSTFLLPDGTKLSFTPGTPASALVTRGQQQIEITNLRPAAAPVAALSADGGLVADASRNDGYIFVMGGGPESWTLAGAPLGDVAESREVVAAEALENEHPIDVTNLTLAPELVTQLEELGVDVAAFDVNEDGRFNSAEIQQLVAALDSAVGGAQSRFETALNHTAGAIEPLMRLTQFIEKLLAESERRQSGREQVAAAERDQLQQIQRDLDAARHELRRNEASTPPQSSSPNVPPPRVVLNAPAPTAPTDLVPAHGEKASPPDSLLPVPVPAPSDGRVVQALRRAERLLSGVTSAPWTPSGVSSRPNELPLAETPPPSPVSPELPPFPVGPGSGDSVGAPPADSPALSPPPESSPPIEPDVNLSDLSPLGASQPGRSGEPRAIPPAPLPAAPPPFTPPASPHPPAAVGDPTTGLPPVDPLPQPPLPTPTGPRAPEKGFPPLSPRRGETAPIVSPDSGYEDAAFPAVASSAPLAPATLPSGQPRPAPVPGQSPRGEDARPPLPPLERTAAPVAVAPPAPPEAPSGLAPLPGTGFPATGPDPLVAPDPTFGSSDGFHQEARRRLDQQLSVHRDQVTRMHQLQSEVRHVVENFVTLIRQDSHLREVFRADDLSGEQHTVFRGKVEELERELGLSWGGEPTRTPQAESNLHARVLASGMMI